jgi:hypothetical protein
LLPQAAYFKYRIPTYALPLVTDVRDSPGVPGCDINCLASSLSGGGSCCKLWPSAKIAAPRTTPGASLLLLPMLLVLLLLLSLL